jgi:CHAP domain
LENTVPFINGRFYTNPAYGRALERARAAEAERTFAPERADPQQQDEDGHWVTMDHRHVLIHETSDRIVRTAKKYNGSTAWAFAKRKDDFAPGTNKCNKFVYDVTKEAGAPAIVIGSDGKPRPPLAAEWADPRTPIPGWRALGPNETPQPGDVAAYKLPGHATYTGHSGIVTGVDANDTVHAIAAHGNLVGPDDKFQRVRGVTFRRYTGGE